MYRLTTLVCGMTIAGALAVSPMANCEETKGKAIFNTSCIECHGRTGAGNSVQDRYWKMRIPRLNGSYVQNLTDSQLTNVILNGKRKMPAAMMGYPHTTNRTKVTAEQIPDLLAYIHSLKNSK